MGRHSPVLERIHWGGGLSLLQPRSGPQRRTVGFLRCLHFVRLNLVPVPSGGYYVVASVRPFLLGFIFLGEKVVIISVLREKGLSLV